jgi:hypothetical protein
MAPTITAADCVSAINRFAHAHELHDRISLDEVVRQAGVERASSFDVTTAHYAWLVCLSDTLDGAQVVDCSLLDRSAPALPERDMDGSPFVEYLTPAQERAHDLAARAEQERWHALTPEQQHAELLDEACATGADTAIDYAAGVQVDEACPGCGCLPGEGVTIDCTHPDGCGFYHALELS